MADEQDPFRAYNSYSDQVLHGKYIKKDVTATYVKLSSVLCRLGYFILEIIIFKLEFGLDPLAPS